MLYMVMMEMTFLVMVVFFVVGVVSLSGIVVRVWDCI